MDYTLDEVRAFLTVASLGGFTAAARHLGVTTNAVSLRVQRLERAVGVRLLVRTTRSVALSDEGRAFHARAVAAVELLERANSEARSGSSGLRGVVRLALPGALATPSILAPLDELLRLNLNLSVQLRVTNIAVSPVSEGHDIVVVVGQPPDSTLVGRRLGRVTWVLVASPTYLARRGRPASPGDLASHSCLRLAGGQREWTLVDERGGEQVVPVGGSFEADDSRVLGDAAYLGMGIGIRPLGECVAAVRAGTLERVLPGFHFEPLDVYALLPPGRQALARVAACLAVLQEAVAALA